MEKGNVPIEYKGKSLADIDIDPNKLFVEEHDIRGIITLYSN